MLYGMEVDLLRESELYHQAGDVDQESQLLVDNFTE